MTVDLDTKVITIYQGDLNLVSGTFYTGDTDTLRILMNILAASETGIIFPDPNRHNTEVGPIVGTTYARTIEMINGYSITFSPNSAWTVQLENSNNNMWDVGGGILNQNQVQVIPTNSAGLQIVTSGSGVLPGDVADIADAVWDEASADHVIAATMGKLVEQLQLKIDELHRLQGLLVGDGMEVDINTNTRKTDSGITIDVTYPEEGKVRIERQ